MGVPFNYNKTGEMNWDPIRRAMNCGMGVRDCCMIYCVIGARYYEEHNRQTTENARDAMRHQYACITWNNAIYRHR
jgi:hypothetical protein